MENKNKSTMFGLRRLLTFLLVAIMTLSMVFFAACAKDPADEDEDEDETTEELQAELTIANGNFDLLYDNSESDDYPRTPKNWSYSIDGSGDTKAPSSSSDVLHGIIPVNADKFTAANKETDGTKKFGVIETPKTPHVQDTALEYKDKSNVLMLYNKNATSIRYKSPGITIEANTYAVISVWIKTVGITEGGAHINLTGGVEEPVYLKDIITLDTVTDNNGYEQYKIYIEGDKLNSKTVYIELGLGYGDKYDKRDQMTGHAFFDDAELSYLSEKDFISQAGYYSENGSFSIGSNVHEAFSIVANGSPFEEHIVSATGTNFNRAARYAYNKNEGQISAKKSIGSSLTNFGTKTANDVAKEFMIGSNDFTGNNKEALDKIATDYPFHSSNKDVFWMQNDSRISQSIVTSKQTLDPYSYYKVSFWIKTTDFDDGTGLNVFLTNNVSKNTVPTAQTKYKSYGSFTNIDTTTDEKDLTDEKIAKTHKNANWVKYTFLLETGKYGTEDVALEFALGPQFPDKYAEAIEYTMPVGSALITTINFDQIAKTVYTSASTGNTTTKATVSTSSTSTATISNGGFDTVQNSYGGTLDFDANGAYAPSDWIGVPYKHNQVQGGGIEDSEFANFNKILHGIYNQYRFNGSRYYFENGNPTALVIDGRAANSTAFAYLSPYKNLSANSYYKISLDVLASTGTPFGVYLVDKDGKVMGDASYKNLEKPADKEEDELKDYEKYDKDSKTSMFIEGTGAGITTIADQKPTGWKTYNIYIKTGNDAKDFRVELWLGNAKYSLQNLDGTAISRDNAVTTNGIVYYDNVSVDSSSEQIFKDFRKDNTISDDTMMFVSTSKDTIFADYSRANPAPKVEEEEEEEEEKKDEEEEKFDWGLLVTALSTGLIVIALAIVGIRKAMIAGKKRKVKKSKNEVDSQYDKTLKRKHSDNEEDEEYETEKLEDGESDKEEIEETETEEDEEEIKHSIDDSDLEVEDSSDLDDDIEDKE